MFNTVEEIAEDVLRNNNIKRLQKLFNPGTDFLAKRELLIEFPRWIRNSYDLWNPDNPLTTKWHSGERLIIEGCDCTSSHPDQVSAAVMRGIKRKLAP